MAPSVTGYLSVAADQVVKDKIDRASGLELNEVILPEVVHVKRIGSVALSRGQ